jgi:hypothetical protein
MKTLQNFARPVNLYMGDFVNDGEHSDFVAESFFQLPYSIFMASFYRLTDMIDTNDGLKFIITESALEKALIDWSDNITDGEKLSIIKYKL